MRTRIEIGPVFEAQFQGRCACCECWFRPGTKVRMTEDGAIHEYCAPDVLPPEAVRETCPTCWTIKAVNGRCHCA